MTMKDILRWGTDFDIDFVEWLERRVIDGNKITFIKHRFEWSRK